MRYLLFIFLCVALPASAFATTNETCAQAIPITPNAIGVNCQFSGRLVGDFTANSTNSGEGCADTRIDQWYTFSLGIQGTYTVDVQVENFNINNTNSFDVDLQLYYGSCGNLTPIDCSSDPGFISGRQFSGLPAGTDIYVRVLSTPFFPGEDYSMCVVQNCAWAEYEKICLGNNTFRHQVTVSELPAGGTYQLRDFPPPGGGTVFIDNISAPGTYTSPIQTLGGFGTAMSTVLTNNNSCELYFQERYTDPCYTSTNPPLNNQCNQAYDLDLGTAQCGVPSTSGTRLATNTFSSFDQSDITAAGGTLGPNAREVWYTAINTDNVDRDISLEFTDSEPDYYIVGFRDFCQARELRVVGAPGQAVTIANVAPGQLVLFAVVTNTDPATGDEFVGVCGRIDPPATPSPPNDDFADALPIPAGVCPGISGNTLYAESQNFNDAACGYFVSPADDDIWYSFQPINGRIDLRFINVTGDLEAQIWYDNGSGTLQLHDCYDLPRLIVNELPTGAAQYYLRVFSAGVGNSVSFTVCNIADAAYVTPADDCANAVVVDLQEAADCPTTFTRTSTADATESLPSNSPLSGTANDVWFQFTATSSQMTVRLNSVQQVNHAIQNNGMLLDLYTGSCGNLTLENQFVADGATVQLTVGTTYYLRAFSFFGGDLLFDLCLERPDAPANDECVTAQPVGVSATPDCGASVISGTTDFATPSAPASTCVGTPDVDVWYSFVATAAAVQIGLDNVTKTGGNFGGTDAVLALYGGSCNALTDLACGTNDLSYAALTPGDTYYLRVYAADAGVYLSYDLCLVTPPPNDLCADAITVTPSATTACATPTTGTLQAATATAPGGCFPGATPVADVFYQFVATATAHVITLSGTNGNSYGVAARLDNCAATETTCNFDELRLDNLTVGQTVYLRVFAQNGQTPGTFELCVAVPPPPPANDEPAGAVLLTYAQFCDNPITGTVEAATETTGPQCGVCSFQALDVWYRFTAPQAALKVSVVPEDFAAFAVELFSGTDLANDYLACATDNSFEGATTLSATGLTPGQTYYLRVYEANCNGALTGTNARFAICVNNLPSVVLPQSFGSCAATSSVQSTGSNEWLFLTDNGQPALAILDSEAMGTIDGSYFNSFYNPPRQNANGLEAVDRNFTATPATQPASPVRVRVFISQGEYQRFIQNQDGDGNDANDLSDLVVYRFGNQACGSTVPTGGTLHVPTATGQISSTGYYVEIEIPGFSAFFVSGDGGSTLPVTWQSVTAARTGTQRVLVAWTTATERANAGFDVERSTDGRTFIAIGAVAAAGNSDAAQSYHFTDTAAPAGGTLYFRIRQVDHDGSASYSRVVAVDMEARDEFSVAPNPVDAELRVAFRANDASDARVTLYDLTGRAVYAQAVAAVAGSNTEVVNTAALAPGIYLLRLRVGERVHTRRVQVQR